MESFKSGITVGNAAAINVELGWIPDYVHVYNATDGDLLTAAFLGKWVIPFSSGGVNEVVAGDKIVGQTSNASAVIEDVLLYSGSWAGGDAAGFFVVSREFLEGTFGAEDVAVEEDGGSDDATVTANVTHCYNSGFGGAVTGNSALSAYVGAAGSNAKGFTIGSTVAEEAKLLRWCAWRDDR